jgi:hypothetical protein
MTSTTILPEEKIKQALQEFHQWKIEQTERKKKMDEEIKKLQSKTIIDSLKQFVHDTIQKFTTAQQKTQNPYYEKSMLFLDTYFSNSSTKANNHLILQEFEVPYHLRGVAVEQIVALFKSDPAVFSSFKSTIDDPSSIFYQSQISIQVILKPDCIYEYKIVLCLDYFHQNQQAERDDIASSFTLVDNNDDHDEDQNIGGGDGGDRGELKPLLSSSEETNELTTAKTFQQIQSDLEKYIIEQTQIVETFKNNLRAKLKQKVKKWLEEQAQVFEQYDFKPEYNPYFAKIASFFNQVKNGCQIKLNNNWVELNVTKLEPWSDQLLKNYDEYQIIQELLKMQQEKKEPITNDKWSVVQIEKPNSSFHDCLLTLVYLKRNIGSEIALYIYFPYQNLKDILPPIKKHDFGICTIL